MTVSPFFEAFQQAAQAMLLLDLTGRIRAANARMAEALQAPAEQLVGRLPVELPCWPLLGDAGDRLLALHAHAVAGAGARHTVDVALDATLADAAARRVEVAVTPLRDGTGAVQWVLVEARSASGVMSASAGVGASGARGDAAAVGRVVAQVAHEINNPLAGIQNAFLLVRDAIPPDHPHARFAGAIEREIGRIATITRRLVATYRPDESMDGRPTTPGAGGVP